MAQPPFSDDPEKLYGPTSAWEGLHLGAQGHDPPPVDQTPPADQAPPAKVQVDPELLQLLDRRYNEALADFATKLQANMLEKLDQKLVAAFNTQAALNSPAAQTGPNPAAAPTPAVPSGPSMEAMATAAMPIINMIAAKFLGAPPAEAAAGMLTAKFKEVADVVTMVNTTFMGNHDESVRMGMRMASDAYTFAYKATGVVPEAAAFNASLTPVTAPADGAPAGLSSRTFDFAAEAARIAGKLGEK